jgi:hypothetical protein
VRRRAQLLQDVVHLGEGEPGVLGLARLAVRVQFLRDGANLGLQGVGADGEGEGVEAAGFDVDWIVALAEPASGAERPS